MIMKTRTAILMVRVSSDEQAKGYSLDIQETSIKKWCADHDVEILKIFREDHSAKDFNRPKWKELKAFAKTNHKQIDMLLVTTWDRFSRNTTDAFNELFTFKKWGIEVQSIQQPIDFSIPESKVLLSIYLTLPEVDNDRRSMKIREGIRAALKSGRWSRIAPVGYTNTRDINHKPQIVPGEKAYLIKWAFEEISKGATQEYVRKTINQKGLKVSRNNISLLLRNLVYIGKIRVPGFEKEPEEIVDGLHAPIVSVDLFYKVQEVLSQNYNKRNRTKQNSAREELPLRGLLYCSNCGNKVTGSASRSKTGAKHYYYHCNCCKKERYKASLPNECIENFLDELEFIKSAQFIYNDMIETLLKEKSAATPPINIATVKSKIQLLSNRIDKLQDLLVDDIISAEDYHKKKSQYQTELKDLKESIKAHSLENPDLKKKIAGGINFLANIKSTYANADVIHKQRLLSSIFPEKIVFSKNKCRTPRINSLLLHILLNNKKLRQIKTGQSDQKIELSRQVESPGIEPGSKQATKELSTRLFPVWVFDVGLGQEQPPNA